LRGDSVSVRLVDVDLRAAAQVLSRYLDRPLLFSAQTGARVTLETPRPIPRADVVRLLRGLVESNGLELVNDTSAGVWRVAQRPPLAPVFTPPPAQQAQSQLGTPRLFVIKLRHARAADVAQTVNALYGRASALGELGGGPRGTLSNQLRQNVVPPQATEPPLALAPGIVSPTGNRVAQLAGETTIVPDAGSNALLVRASAGDFELIRAAVQELDVRPLQVLIEVIIAEVRRDRGLDFGVTTNVSQAQLPGRGDLTLGGAVAGGGPGDFVLRLMRKGNGFNLDATLRAAQTRGDVSILSRPVLLAANNEPAEILVGSQRPFIQVQRSLPTDAPQRDQVIQYKDVGTRLGIRPTISADGYVMLEVTQEVNAATTETAFDAPVISTRSVQTRLLIKDGQTIALGGLTDRQRDRTRSGVPILSQIPVLGGLFGRSSRRTTETELYLFLTPRVIRSDEDAVDVTTPLRERANEAKP
jgi:general secretion pathway protein D